MPPRVPSTLGLGYIGSKLRNLSLLITRTLPYPSTANHAKSCQRSVCCEGFVSTLRMAKVSLLGVLVECDPSIKAIILKIDQDKHDYIVEDLDDQTLVVKESQLATLKARLEEVDCPAYLILRCPFLILLPGACKHPADARRLWI